MSPIQSYITEYLAGLSGIYFVRQYIVLICLFLFGAILSDVLLGKNESWMRRAVIAFPLGMSAFVITSYAMLVIGIPYRTSTVTVIWAAEAAAALFFGRKSFASFDRRSVKHMLIAAGAVLAAGAVAVSGIVPVSISNDSMYYFKRYPDCIVYFGGLRDQFDFWLTDTGLGIVSFDTLPALYGFGETFGIREFFHISFLAFFGMSVHDRAKKHTEHAIAAAVIVTLVLAVSTPFVILGHWALANMYFMEMFFISAYAAYDYDKSGIWAKSLLMVALSLFRIEGTIFVVWMILCVSYHSEDGKAYVKRALIPMMILFSGYCIKIFTQFYVFDNTYLFLTPMKAVLLIAAMAAAGMYILFLEGAVRKKTGPAVYIGVLLAGNIFLLLYDRAHYIGNLMAFRANLFRQSGWGMLPYFVIAATVLLVAEYALRRNRMKDAFSKPDSFSMTLTIGFLLIVLAASFGRGDVLAEDVGDSGNRVLLQIVPLIVMTFAELFISLMDGGAAEDGSEQQRTQNG